MVQSEDRHSLYVSPDTDGVLRRKLQAAYAVGIREINE
jgi:hypothetical protein